MLFTCQAKGRKFLKDGSKNIVSSFLKPTSQQDRSKARTISNQADLLRTDTKEVVIKELCSFQKGPMPGHSSCLNRQTTLDHDYWAPGTTRPPSSDLGRPNTPTAQGQPTCDFTSERTREFTENSSSRSILKTLEYHGISTWENIELARNAAEYLWVAS